MGSWAQVLRREYQAVPVRIETMGLATRPAHHAAAGVVTRWLDSLVCGTRVLTKSTGCFYRLRAICTRSKHGRLTEGNKNCDYDKPAHSNRRHAYFVPSKDPS